MLPGTRLSGLMSAGEGSVYVSHFSANKSYKYYKEFFVMVLFHGCLVAEGTYLKRVRY